MTDARHLSKAFLDRRKPQVIETRFRIWVVIFPPATCHDDLKTFQTFETGPRVRRYHVKTTAAKTKVPFDPTAEMKVTGATHKIGCAPKQNLTIHAMVCAKGCVYIQDNMGITVQLQSRNQLDMICTDSDA